MYNKISGDSIVSISRSGVPAGTIMPKGPGKSWKIINAVNAVDSSTAVRSFTRGKSMFAATLCSSCHQMKGEGGVAGPDLTQLGTRFSTKDILESIIEPSKTISDQFGSTIFSLKKAVLFWVA